MSGETDGISGQHPAAIIAAIVWDYDGTLVDTWQKNLRVTRAIIKETTGVDPTTYPALQSEELYAGALARSANWREFYKTEFAFTDAETDDAGRKWTEFQMRDSTPTPVFNGIHGVLHRLRDIPHGIVSQSSRDAILCALKESDLLQYFGSIVGFEEVELRRQKPKPDGLLRCIDELTRSHGGHVLYIGDHETDAACAHAANKVLHSRKSGLSIRSIGALYSSQQETSHWRIKPDYEARQTHNIIDVVDSVRGLAVVGH